MVAALRLKVFTGMMTLGLVAAAAWAVSTRRGHDGCAADECTPAAALPDAIRFGARAPAVVVALFVDLEAAASRQAFQHATRAVGGGRLGVDAELRLLHLPAAVCADDATRLACAGARLVECAESLVPGTGVRAAGAGLDLQWRAADERTAEQAARAIAGLGVDAAALQRCADGDARGVATLQRHAALARQLGLTAAPGGFVVVVDDLQRSAGFGAWVSEDALRTLVRCLLERRCGEAA